MNAQLNPKVLTGIVGFALVLITVSFVMTVVTALQAPQVSATHTQTHTVPMPAGQ